jgi:hypothetical protein
MKKIMNEIEMFFSPRSRLFAHNDIFSSIIAVHSVQKYLSVNVLLGLNFGV